MRRALPHPQVAGERASHLQGYRIPHGAPRNHGVCRRRQPHISQPHHRYRHPHIRKAPGEHADAYHSAPPDRGAALCQAPAGADSLACPYKVESELESGNLVQYGRDIGKGAAVAGEGREHLKHGDEFVGIEEKLAAAGGYSNYPVESEKVDGSAEGHCNIVVGPCPCAGSKGFPACAGQGESAVFVKCKHGAARLDADFLQVCVEGALELVFVGRGGKGSKFVVGFHCRGDALIGPAAGEIYGGHLVEEGSEEVVETVGADGRSGLLD